MASLTIEIPQGLADALASHVRQRPDGSTDKAVAGAIALWLLQNGHSGPEVRRAYVEAAFPGYRAAA